MSELVGGPVPTHAIRVRLNRHPSDTEVDTMRARDGDVRVDRDGGHSMLRISRERETLSVAIAEAIDDVAAVPGLNVLWVEPVESGG